MVRRMQRCSDSMHQKMLQTKVAVPIPAVLATSNESGWSVESALLANSFLESDKQVRAVDRDVGHSKSGN